MGLELRRTSATVSVVIICAFRPHRFHIGRHLISCTAPPVTQRRFHVGPHLHVRVALPVTRGKVGPEHGRAQEGEAGHRTRGEGGAQRGGRESEACLDARGQGCPRWGQGCRM